jgi:ABC-type transport system substrate-binding protein
MPRRLRRLELGIVAAALAASLSLALSGGSAAPGPPVLRYVEGTDPTPMDPAFVTDTPTWSLLHLLYDNLVAFGGPDLKVVPDLATGWKTGADKRTWTFTLRRGVQFTDGTPVNAQAVVYSLQRIMDPKTASPYRATFGPIESVKALDDATVQIVTKTPYADLLVLLAQVAGGIVSPTAAQKDASEPKRFGEHPVGSGMFMVKSWVPGDQTVLVRNPRYWGKPAALESVTWRGVPDASVREAMVKSGQADIAVKPPLQDVAALQKAAGLRVLVQPSMYTISIELNNTEKPLDDVRVRRALNYAVDKASIVKNILLGYGRVNDSPIPFGTQYRIALEPYAYDPAKAKALLAEAGQEHFSLDLWAPKGRYMEDSQVGEAVANYLQAVGVNVKYRVWEWAPYLKAINSPERRAFMVGRATPGMDFTMTRLFSKEAWNQYNISLFYDPRVEKLILEGRSTFDDAARARIYADAQRLIWDHAPYIFLHNQDQIYLLRDAVKGFKTLPHEVVYMEGVTLGP